MPDRLKTIQRDLSVWMQQLADSGRSEYLFELEMWLRSLERYFRIANQPMASSAVERLALRSFYQELDLVAQVIDRVNELCGFLSSEDRVSQERFDKYVENALKSREVADPYLARLLQDESPRAGVTLLRESFEDMKLLLRQLTQLSRIPFSSFASLGRLLYREIHRNEHLSVLLRRRFKPTYDRISNERIRSLVYDIVEPDERLLVANVFLHFFRMLHYLEYADPRERRSRDLRITILVFSLVASEARELVDFLESRLKRDNVDPKLDDTLQGFLCSIPLEVRKVINTELTEVSSFKRVDTVYMRVENAHGILRDCIQQSVIILAQTFVPEIQGPDVFQQFQTRFEQSLVLQKDLRALLHSIRGFVKLQDAASLDKMKREVSRFYEKSLRFLMYRDWAPFESFTMEILKNENTTMVLHIAHRFETFMQTLEAEVSKRTVLQARSEQRSLSFPPEVAASDRFPR